MRKRRWKQNQRKEVNKNKAVRLDRDHKEAEMHKPLWQPHNDMRGEEHEEDKPENSPSLVMTIRDEIPQPRVRRNINSSPTLFQFTLTHAELATKKGECDRAQTNWKGEQESKRDT